LKAIAIVPGTAGSRLVERPEPSIYWSAVRGRYRRGVVLAGSVQRHNARLGVGDFDALIMEMLLTTGLVSVILGTASGEWRSKCFPYPEVKRKCSYC